MSSKEEIIKELKNLINEEDKTPKMIVTEYNLFGKFLVMTKIKYSAKKE